jgi:hypothetical protein
MLSGLLPMEVHTRLKMVKSRLQTFVAGLGRVSLDTGTSRYAMAGSDLLSLFVSSSLHAWVRKSAHGLPLHRLSRPQTNSCAPGGRIGSPALTIVQGERKRK